MLVGCLVYLYVAHPNEVVTVAILGFVGAVITYWFVSKATNPPSGS